MSEGYDEPFDDESHRPVPPPQDRVWLHPSEMGARRAPPRRQRSGPLVALVMAGVAALLVGAVLVNRGMALSTRQDVDSSGAAQLTASTALATSTTTTTALVTDVGLIAYVGIEGYDDEGGIRITRCISHGPAATAGARVGDLLMVLAGSPTRTTAQFQALVRRLRPGQHVHALVLRNGATVALTITLGQDG